MQDLYSYITFSAEQTLAPAEDACDVWRCCCMQQFRAANGFCNFILTYYTYVSGSSDFHEKNAFTKSRYLFHLVCLVIFYYYFYGYITQNDLTKQK